MRLKTLEIKGFKSFANETVINFNENVIGIVGPNGSGKSNVVDAIRWVLGEQKSSELRLDKMNSVIFNGTKKRKPGQLAQVSLTFDNTKNLLPTDYTTIKITRILYASGESEYRLNGVTCRLKDITSLFMDTGVGSNSYAIIALGMVDEILNDKQNSRRMMLEQAAGVSKYKARKHETLNKLNATEEDLNRIEDLLFEITNNLKTLEKQAARTQKYLDIKTEYREKAIDLAVLKLSVFKNDYKQTEKNIEIETDRYRQLDTEGVKLEAQIERDKKANLDKEQELSERQRELNSVVGRLRGMENDKRMAQQRKLFSEQNITKLVEQVNASKARVEKLADEIAYYREEISAEKRLESKLEDQLEQAKAKLDAIRNDHGTLKADLDVFLKQQQAIEREINELEKQKAIANNQIENNTREAERTENETQGRRNEVNILRGQLADLEKKENTQVAEIQYLEGEETKRLADLEKANQKLELVTKKLADTNRSLDAKKNEFKLTKSMVESLEGFPESIQFLSKNKTFTAPLLGDLIYVQEGYRTAVENYLEPFLNHYVVQNAEEAIAAVRLLNNAQKGKAHFFVLDAFKNTSFATKGLLNARPAVDLIQVDMAYQVLFDYLLQNVLIVENDSDIQSFDFDENTVQGTPFGEGAILLSKSGGFSKRRFSVSGGSVGLFEGKKIGRKKNLEVLEKQIKETEAEAADLQKQLGQVRGDISFLKSNEQKAAIQRVQNELNHIRQQKVFLQTRIDNFSTFINEADVKKRRATDQVEGLKKSIENIDSQLVEKKKAEDEVKNQMVAADGSYRSVADLMSQLSMAFNEKNVEFIRQQNKVSTLQRELGFREKNLSDTEGGIATANRSLAQAKDELEQIDNELVTFDNSLQDFYKQRRQRESGLSEFEQSFFKKKNEIVKMEDDLRRINRQRGEIQSLVNNLKDKFNDIKLQITSIGDRLNVEFGVSVNDLINETPKQGLVREELQKKTDDLKRRLDTYGEINPLAVEAYNEMKERHDTIAGQRDDILNAKNSLLATIKEIEETATAQFLEAFETVRKHFIEVFKSLFFEEDTADMILTDPQNPLESGINIVAKPKGKRPQSISQLSGGEKTLTATAFLFALYLYKPAPFCIFDEVDAPLDDANIEKFNKIIQKFSVDSQFIIVTHNKATMAAVDIIYGVHMPEQGVSTVTAVDFREFGNVAELAAV
ncbi:MAG: chromosome segregation protein SMC [Saprospiraceae bacterium]|nr:chromosome segregation protein SMC [Saprospiraceae bacterium]